VLRGAAVVGAGLAPWLGGCGTQTTGGTSGMSGNTAPAAAGTPKVGGTLRLAVTTDPDTLDLHQTSNSASSTVFGKINAPVLVFQDFDKQYKPWLAEKIDVAPDNTTVTFTLRQGVKFTNGDPVDAAAMKYTFERLQQIGTKSTLYEVAKNFTSIEAVDARTVRIKLGTPQATLLHDLQTAYGGILSPKAVQAAGDNYGRQPVGSGPYKLESWKSGQEVILARNPDFAWPESYYKNKGAPYFERISYRVIPEAATRQQLFEAGEIDVLGLTAANANQYDNDKRFKVYKSNSASLAYLGFNCQRPPFTDRKLRQALSHAVDKNAIVKVALGGELGQAVNTPLPPSVLGYDDKLGQFNYQYDVNKAKSLLAELGYKAGSDGMLAKDGQPFKPVLYTSTDTTYSKIATILQSQFKAAGVDLQIKTLESGVLLQTTPKGEHDLLLLGWNWNEPDALFLFLSKTRLASSNRVLWVNEEFEKLITDARAEMNQDKRLKMYADAQKIVLQEAPWQPLYMPIDKTAVSARLQGVMPHPAGGLLYHDAWVAG